MKAERNALARRISFVILTLATGARAQDVFTVVALPDTQYYSSFYEEAFMQQTDWVCRCASDPLMNVVFATHLGDLVHRGNRYRRDWINAARAVRTLLNCDVAFGILPGNHDTDRSTFGNDPYHYYNRMFPVEEQHDRRWFGGCYSDRNMHNTYQLFEALGQHFVFVHLEYLPACNESEAVVAWATEVMHAYSDRTALLSTHFAAGSCPGGYVAFELRQLVHDNCNLALVFAGHVTDCDGERSVALPNQCEGHAQVLVSNYQTRTRGGDGWLRYYTFHPDDGRVCAHTYSPALGKFEEDPDSQFSLNMTTWAVGDECPRAERYECQSHYASPGFVLAVVWIASVNILFLFLVLLLYELPPQARALQRRYVTLATDSTAVDVLKLG